MAARAAIAINSWLNARRRKRIDSFCITIFAVDGIRAKRATAIISANQFLPKAVADITALYNELVRDNSLSMTRISDRILDLESVAVLAEDGLLKITYSKIDQNNPAFSEDNTRIECRF